MPTSVIHKDSSKTFFNKAGIKKPVSTEITFKGH